MSWSTWQLPPTQTDNIATDPRSALGTEQTVLGILLLWDHFTEGTDREACRREFARLHVEDFTDPDHQIIFRAMVDLDGAGSAISLPAITDRVRVVGGLQQEGWELYITSLVNVFSSTAVLAWHVDRMLEASGRRLLLSLAEALLAEAKAMKPNYEALAQMTARAVEAFRAGAPALALAPKKRRGRNS